MVFLGGKRRESVGCLEMLFQGKIGVGGEGELSPCGGQGGRVKIKPPGLVGGGYIWGTWRGGGPFSHKITAAKEKGRWPSSNFFAASAVTSAMLESRLLIPKRRAAFYLTSARNCLSPPFSPFFLAAPALRNQEQQIGRAEGGKERGRLFLCFLHS